MDKRLKRYVHFFAVSLRLLPKPKLPRLLRRLSVCCVLAVLLAGTPLIVSAAGPAARDAAVLPVAGPVTPATSIHYLNLSVSLANRLHTSLLNRTSNAYYFSVSSNWATLASTQYSTLGNALIVAGLMELFEATQNQTYLLWASTTSDQFWKGAWAKGTGGFYDTYNPNWSKSTCEQIAQDNAMFEIDFLDLYRLNGSSQWLQRADSEEALLNQRFWNTTDGVVEVGYTPCTGQQSGDVDIETSIGSYLWATGEWTSISGNTSYLARMNAAASFAHRYLWDGTSNSLQGGPDSTGCAGSAGSLGFMRSVYANLTGLEDCPKGANENIWGAMGLAELYGLTGNSTLLDWTDQDLSWINSTLWDPTYGGYHNDVFRNDTLRSSCSSTNEPNDYPGWTQGEQPMFWWQIGQLTHNASMTAWSLVAERWTADHQWNSTDGNGGDMTCLNGNTSPDVGSPDLYDWIQGSALYSFSTLGSPQTTYTSTTTSTIFTQSRASTAATSSVTLTSSSTVITHVPEFSAAVFIPLAVLALVLMTVAGLAVRWRKVFKGGSGVSGEPVRGAPRAAGVP